MLEISHRALIYKIKEYGLDKVLPDQLKSYKEEELMPAAGLDEAKALEPGEEKTRT